MTERKWIRTGVATIPTVLTVLTVLLVAPLAQAGEDWVVEEKKLAVASGLSKPLRADLSAMGPPNAAARRSVSPGSIEEWRALVKALNEENPTTIAAMEKMFGVQVESAQLAGVNVYEVVPATINPVHKAHVFIHLHGGGYLLGGGAKGVREAAAIASRAGIKALAVDYTLSAERPFPAGLNDVVAVYNELLKTVPATAIGMGGTSAGGGLALATVHRLKADHTPLPGALFAGSPWADLAATGDTIETMEGIDQILPTHEGFLDNAARLYAGDHALTHPLISPYYGDFSDFPPTYLLSGTRDLLLSDTARVHRKLRAAGVTAELNVYEGVPHGGYTFSPGSREFAESYGELGEFLLRHLSAAP